MSIVLDKQALKRAVRRAAKRYDEDRQVRDEAIRNAVAAGISYREIAQDAGISFQRVSQIVGPKTRAK